MSASPVVSNLCLTITRERNLSTLRLGILHQVTPFEKYKCIKLIAIWFQIAGLKTNDFTLSQFSSVQFSRSVVSDSLWPHESQHSRPLCPSPTPGVYPNSCASSRWCHLDLILCRPLLLLPPIPPSIRESMSQLFAWSGQSIGVSASALVLPMNTQDWSPLGWTGWISLQSKSLSRVFSNTTV